MVKTISLYWVPIAPENERHKQEAQLSLTMDLPLTGHYSKGLIQSSEFPTAASWETSQDMLMLKAGTSDSV